MIDYEYVNSILKNTLSAELGEPGGWKALRPRTDKSANAFQVAEKIWATITGFDIRE